MRKRGSSHIEMILSFVIFMIAIGFAFYFFRPGDNSRLVESSFSYLFREIEKNASSEVLTYSIKINNGSFSDKVIGFNVSGSSLDYHSKVFRTNGDEIESGKNGEIVFANSPEGWNYTDFVDLVLAEELNDSTYTGTINEDYYKISSSLKKDVLSEKKLRRLKIFYENNYTKIKKQFNIPNRVNFIFDFRFSDGSEINVEQNVPKNLEVLVQNKRLEMLRESGAIEFGELTIKVW